MEKLRRFTAQFEYIYLGYKINTPNCKTLHASIQLLMVSGQWEVNHL